MSCTGCSAGMTGFAPMAVTGIGLGSWRYRGDPWEKLARCDFVP
jgi:hypothetical protein